MASEYNVVMHRELNYKVIQSEKFDFMTYCFRDVRALSVRRVRR